MELLATFAALYSGEFPMHAYDGVSNDVIGTHDVPCFAGCSLSRFACRGSGIASDDARLRFVRIEDFSSSTALEPRPHQRLVGRC